MSFTSMKRCLFISLMFTLLAEPAIAAMKPGERAPAFTLSSESGEIVSLPKNGGKVLSFFASWCQPCRDELTLLDSVTEELKKQGITVVLIGVKEDYGKIRALLTELNVKKPVVLSDKNGKVTELYQVRFLPTTFFVGTDGIVKDVIYGEIRNVAELHNSVNKLHQ